MKKWAMWVIAADVVLLIAFSVGLYLEGRYRNPHSRIHVLDRNPNFVAAQKSVSGTSPSLQKLNVCDVEPLDIVMVGAATETRTGSAKLVKPLGFEQVIDAPGYKVWAETVSRDLGCRDIEIEADEFTFASVMVMRYLPKPFYPIPKELR